jgi:hypothetical protein
MKKNLFILMFFTIITNNSIAQQYCSVHFEAHSIKRAEYCKYCNKSSEFTVPYKINFQKKIICNTLYYPKNASSEEKCKTESLMYYITYLYYCGWYNGNAFYHEKCSSINNPNSLHEVYRRDDVDVGIKQYDCEDYELKAKVESMESTKNYIDKSSYKEGTNVSISYSLECIKFSCPK